MISVWLTLAGLLVVSRTFLGYGSIQLNVWWGGIQFLVCFVFLDLPSTYHYGIFIPGHLLPVENEWCRILPLRLIDTYPTSWYQIFLDTSVGVPRHCYGDPTLDIDAYPLVGLPPLGGKMAGHSFQNVIQLGMHKSV